MFVNIIFNKFNILELDVKYTNKEEVQKSNRFIKQEKMSDDEILEKNDNVKYDQNILHESIDIKVESIKVEEFVVCQLSKFEETEEHDDKEYIRNRININEGKKIKVNVR